jgi:alpha-beta hydrolase superfamily lysophospholipase
MALSVWTAPDQRGAVVFIPGTAVHPLFYEEFLDGLCTAGFSVVGVHLRGHGKSPRVRGPLRWTDVVANCVDAVTWTALEIGGPVVLMGSSQGSLAALLAAAAGAPARGVLVHNVFDPTAHETAEVTRFGWAEGVHRAAHAALRGSARVLPNLPVPITAYLEPDRVFGAAWTRELFELDPLSLRTYPLRFLADLVTADTRGLYDGTIRVPVVVMAARGDPLFPLAGQRARAARLSAPSVELKVLPVDCHLVLNEALDLALPAAVSAIDRLLSPVEGSHAAAAP